MEHKSIDPVLWDVAKYIVDNGDDSFDHIQSEFGIDSERAQTLIDYLWTAGIVTMTTFGPRTNYFNEDDLWNRYSLIDFIYNNCTEIKSIAPNADVLDKGRIIEANAKIDNFECYLCLCVNEDELMCRLSVRPQVLSEEATANDESFVSLFIKDEFKDSAWEYEDSHALYKYFPIDFYDCAFDWYKNVLTKFMELREQ